MPRDNSSSQSTAEQERPEVGTRPRGRRWPRWALMAGVVLAIVAFLLPNILRPWATSQINQAIPGHAQIGKLELSWWAPVAAVDVSVSPDSDEEMLKVGRVDTGKNLLSLLASQSVDQVKLTDVSLEVRHKDGTSNLERWIEQFPPSDGTPIPPIKVTIADGEFRMFIDGSQRPTFALSEVVAGVEVEGDVYNVQAKAKDNATDQPLQLTVALRLGAGQLQMNVQGIDLASVAPWLLRMEPRSRLRGIIDSKADVQWTNNRLHGTVEKFLATNVDVNLPHLKMTPVGLQSLEGSGDFDISTSMIKLDGRVVCDAGSIVAKQLQASLPERAFDWQAFVGPLRGDLDVDLDLAKTIAAAPELLPLQKGLHITGGKATVKIRGGTEPHERLLLETVLTDVEARGVTETLRWHEPVQLTLDVNRERGLQVENLQVNSEFLVARLNGSFERGNGTVSGDLGKLHTELSRWLELPVDEARGRLSGELHWELNGSEIVGRGELDVLDAYVKPDGLTPWSDGRVHVDWNSLANIDANNVPTMMSGDLVVSTSTADRVEWHAKQAAVGLAWTGDARMDLGRIPASTLNAAPGTIMSGILSGNISAVTDEKTTTVSLLKGEIESFRLEGEGIAVREPAIVLSGSGTLDSKKSLLRLDEFQFTSTTVALGGKQLELRWDDTETFSLDAAVRSDLSKLDRWVPASRSDRYRWGGEFVGNVLIKRSKQQTAVQWNGHVDQFSLRRAAIGGVTNAIAPLSDVLWQEDRLTTAGAGVYKPELQTVALKGDLNGDAIQISVDGNVEDVVSRPLADLAGTIKYDYRFLETKLQTLLGPAIKIAGKGEQKFQVTGPLLADASVEQHLRPVVHPKLKASAGVGWDSASGYGVEVGKGQLQANLKDSILTFTPLDFNLAGGKLHAEPWIDLRSAPGLVMVRPGQVMQNVEITQEMCRTWIRFVAPAIANATRAEGRFTAQVDHAQMPLGNYMAASAVGTLTIHEGQVGAGPLINEILTIASQVRAIVRQEPLGSSRALATEWVTLPNQEIDFSLANGRMEHKQFVMQVQDVQLITSGAVNLDQTVELVCQIPIRDEWVAKNRLLSPLRGTAVKIPIRGNLADPRADAGILRDLGRQILKGATEDLLRDQLKKGLRGLFD
jgi:translocation and assembly module TamB